MYNDQNHYSAPYEGGGGGGGGEGERERVIVVYAYIMIILWGTLYATSPMDGAFKFFT